LKLLFAIFIYFYIKFPINQYIYGYFSLWFFSFFIACCISFLISKLIYRYIDSIKSHRVFSKYNQYLDIYIFDYLVNTIVVLDSILILLYLNPLSTAPALSSELAARMHDYRFNYLIKTKAARIRSRAKVLEVICGALDRDRTDSRHGPLHDAFKEHISDCQKELWNIAKEARICRIYAVYGNERVMHMRLLERSYENDHLIVNMDFL